MSILNDLEVAFASPAFRQQAGEIIGNECLTLFQQGLADHDAFIRDTCEMLAEALRDKARGELEAEDINAMLIGMQAQLAIQMTNAQIAVRSRMQTIVERLLSLSLSVLVTAL
ncbi:hypothetical protein [Trabulsiella odontotermitis]|uniref:Uncharacterized protein n=1 Tax=Trabulsiella odontotermitis TaxID=379893 RepID=A0A0L0H1Z5_9ENTR|nr:hypothetical protein [Trabulsiella odontotermitis]KNC92349.1 hypothetical protein GM30_17285 [Trabulsiella odontotermitis]KNC95480.1 hypothetical protein GM31_01035 [Trabulsiella odontotermitis]